MLLKLTILALVGAVLVGAAPAPVPGPAPAPGPAPGPSPYPPYLGASLLPAHSYSSVIHYPSYYKYPYSYLSYPYYGSYPYKYYGYGYPYYL